MSTLKRITHVTHKTVDHPNSTIRHETNVTESVNILRFLSYQFVRSIFTPFFW